MPRSSSPPPGGWDLSFVWAIVSVMTAFYLVLAAFADPDMMRERQAPGPGNRDRLTRSLGGVLLLGHWVLVGLDVGRFNWSLVPWGVQVSGVVGYAAALGSISGRCGPTRSTRLWSGCRRIAGSIPWPAALTDSCVTPARRPHCSPCSAAASLWAPGWRCSPSWDSRPCWFAAPYWRTDCYTGNWQGIQNTPRKFATASFQESFERAAGTAGARHSCTHLARRPRRCT